MHVTRLRQVLTFLKQVVTERLGKSEVLDHAFEKINQYSLLFERLNNTMKVALVIGTNVQNNTFH